MFPNRAARWSEWGNFCHFGITEAIGGVLAGALTSAGIGAGAASAIGTGLAGAGLGAAGGAALAGIEGKPLGQGALFGGITGGAVSGLGPIFGGAIGSGTGLSAGTAATLGDIGAGVAGGTLGAVATGQSPLTGALEGGAAGGVAGLSGGAGAGTPSGPTSSTGAATISPAAGSTGGAGGAAGPGPVFLPSGGGSVAVDPTQALGFGAQTDITSFQTPLPANSPALSANLAAGGAGAAAGGGAAGGTAGINNILGFLENNPGLLLGAGALGLDTIMGNKPLPAETGVQNAAAGEAGQARTLESYQQSGTLPPGLQDIVNANTQAGEAQIRSNYANLGLSGSTMEAQAIAQVRQAASAQVAQFANTLAQQGIQLTGLSNQEFNTLLQAQLQQEQGLQGAIASFAGGLAGFRSPSAAPNTAATPAV